MIGTYRCVVIDVTDLEVAYRFWSAVTGWQVIGPPPPGWHGRFGYLGHPEPWKHEMILQVVAESEPTAANRCHFDLTPVDGVDRAIEDIVALGGRLKKPASLYPRPGSRGAADPVIDWAVMQDPFGNEFCLVSELTSGEVAAVRQATANGATTDVEWRRAAGRTV